jgi:hypothetical protein
MAGEHWFDRLTVPHTRRTSLKALAAGLGGAAVATLPGAVEPEPAQAAESPHACRKGCFYVAGQIWRDGINDCGYLGTLEYSLDNLLIHGPIVPWLVPVANIVYAGRMQRCFDRSGAAAMTAAAPCNANNCPGFNPYEGRHAPCQCVPGNYCYPCEASTNGYICCIYAPGDCHGNCCSAGTCI